MPPAYKHLAYALAEILPFLSNRQLQRITGQRMIFPFYHLVSDQPVSHIQHLYRVKTTKEFRNDLDWLLQRFRPVHPLKLLEGNSGSGGFVLSFDDGLREVHDVVLPILREKGISAVFFLNSGFLDNKDLFFRYKAGILAERLIQKPASEPLIKEIRAIFHRRGMIFSGLLQSLLAVDYLHRHILDELAVLLETDFSDYLSFVKPYMDSRQVEACLSAGHLIGAHSVDHPKFSELAMEEQLSQASESLRDLQNRFGLGYGLFSFPFTDDGISLTFFDNLFGGAPRFDLTFGCAGIKHDSVTRNIQRIPMEAGHFNAREVVNGEYLYYLTKKLAGRNTIQRS